MSAREELAAAVAELGALPMPTGDTGPAPMTAGQYSHIRARLSAAARRFGGIDYVSPAFGMVRDAMAEVDRLRARVAELEALKPARFQDCRVCGTGYEYGKPCSFCEFKARIAAEIAKAQAEVTPDQARRIERDHPETNTTHNCTLPLSRRLDCGHCPHEVCPDCQRCPHTCRCASPEVTR